MSAQLTLGVVPIATGAALVVALSSRGGSRSAWSRHDRGARWARRSDLRRLFPRPEEGEARRLVLGTVGGSIRPMTVAAERGQSVAVIGPTQSGKTTCLAVPAILGWEGPVVAASVKSDLLRHTLGARRSKGEVWCIDPTSSTGLPTTRWAVLAQCRAWEGACAVALDLAESSKGEGTTADGEFWLATAAKLLAPLLFAAARGGFTLADVVRWVDTQEVAEVAATLERIGVPEAVAAARATWCRDERTRSSVYTTAETVLAPFSHTEGTTRTFEPRQLLAGRHTLYLCAPAHDQRRLRGFFTALTHQVLAHAFSVSTRAGRALDPPLLVVLDEAAHIAPVAELDGLAATSASHGVQLVTVWHDLAQVRARYGARAPTVLNNHRAKLFLPGIADPDTLEYASALIGEEEVTQPSVTRDPRGARSTTSTVSPRRLLPAASLRCLPRGSAVLVYGTLPPAKLRLRPASTATAPARVGGRRWWLGRGRGSASW